MKLLFIHIPKCGGISMKRFLNEEYKTPIFEGHFTCAQMKAKANLNNYSYDQIITTVRNPYERLVSIYLFLKDKSKEYIHLYKTTDLNVAFKDFTFEQFVKFFLKENCLNYHYMNTYMFLPQKTWLDTEDHVAIYKLEDVNKHFNLKHFNKTNIDYDWKKYYTQELKEIVNIFYKEDFKHFNYTE